MEPVSPLEAPVFRRPHNEQHDERDSTGAHEAPAPRGAPPPEGADPTAQVPGDTTPAPAAGPSYRPALGDVNITALARLRRGTEAAPGPDAETVIGERTTCEGTFRSAGAVRVLGAVQGELESTGAVVIEEQGQVTARIAAVQVTVAGRVEGQIHCPGRVELRPTARVTGELHAGTLIVQEGAFFEGTSAMGTAGAGGEAAEHADVAVGARAGRAAIAAPGIPADERAVRDGSPAAGPPSTPRT